MQNQNDTKLNLTINIEIRNPSQYNECIRFNQTKDIPAQSFEDIAKIMSAFNKLFQEISING